MLKTSTLAHILTIFISNYPQPCKGSIACLIAFAGIAVSIALNILVFCILWDSRFHLCKLPPLKIIRNCHLLLTRSCTVTLYRKNNISHLTKQVWHIEQIRSRGKSVFNATVGDEPHNCNQNVYYTGKP